MEAIPENVRILKNGAVYNMDTKRIVTTRPELAEKNTQITSATAGVLQAKAQSRKRERIQAGALAAVRDKLPDRFDGEGDDWIEAVAEAITHKALDRLDPKQVDAARFLLQETGLSEGKAQAAGGEAVTVSLSVAGLQALAAVLAGNGGDNSYYRKHEQVDGAVLDGAQDWGSAAAYDTGADEGQGVDTGGQAGDMGDDDT